MLRILSQNGLLDIPYEGNPVCIKEITPTECRILCGEYIVAEYNNIEVARLIVSDLRKQYAKNCGAYNGSLHYDMFEPYFEFQ